MSKNQPKVKAKILTQLQRAPILEAACQKSGISRATYYRWLKADPEFAEACAEALEHSTGTINDLAESQLITAIKEQNMTAIIFWLKHHHQAYRTRIQIDAKVKSELEELTPEQAAMISEALRLAGLDRPNEVESHGTK